MVARAVAMFKATDVASGPDDFMAANDTYLFVAERSTEIVGWIYGYRLARPDGRSMLLVYEIDVVATARRRGVGSRLIETMLDVARQSGCNSAWVLTDPENSAALGLYESTGARRSDDQALLRWDLSDPR